MGAKVAKRGSVRRIRPLGGWFPVRLRALGRRCAYLVLEGHSWVFREAVGPPRWLPLVGAGDFQAIGQRYLGYFVDIGRLQPSDHVLDVGCGLGRMAIPLTAFLDTAGAEVAGRYVGFDVDARAIRWCRRRIARHYPNFAFDVADVESRAYCQAGAIDSATYRFPYPDASFDFAIATSVFTHLLPSGARNYLSEVSRVLRPGGRAFMTFFLLSDESQRSIDQGTSKFEFMHDCGTHRVIDPQVPEAAVALPESDVMRWLEDCGMKVVDPVYYGSWSGRNKMLTGQDVIVGVRQ